MALKIGFKAKLTLSYILIILTSFGFIAFFLDRNLEDDSLQEIEASLVNQTYLVRHAITPLFMRAEERAELETAVTTIGRGIRCRITVIDRQGVVRADSERSDSEITRMENHLTRPEIRSAIGGRTGIDIHPSATLKIDMLYVALPIRSGGETIGAIRLARPLLSVEKTLATIRKTVFQGLFFALVLAIVLGSILASQTIGPIDRMIQVSRRFSEGDFSRRVIRYPRDEIGELAATLNTMAGEIEEKIGRIEAQNQKLAAIFRSMIEGIVVTDREGRIVSINHAIENAFGVTAAGAEGKLFLEAIRNNDIADAIGRVLRGGEPFTSEARLVLPVQKVFRTNATPIFTEKAVSGCLVVIHDITEIRRLETVRSDFVANVSHELKTPLTSIKGFVETLLDGAIDEKEASREFLRIISDHTDRLDRLVGELLTLAHLESRTIALAKEPVNLRALTEKIAGGFRAQMQKKAIVFANELPSGFTLEADCDRIEQVLTNLIDNAIKFNKNGGAVRVSGSRSDRTMTICVEDSGSGIPPKDLPRIFERFYRVDKARSRELGGTGLGLSIVKHIIELHGGTVGVESTEGLGATFWFTLPA